MAGAERSQELGCSWVGQFLHTQPAAVGAEMQAALTQGDLLVHSCS